MQVELRNPSGLDVVADVSFSAALDGQAPQPYKLDWGDGTIVQIASGSPLATHTYAKAGWYDVTVQSNNTSSRQKVEVGPSAFPAPGAAVRRTQEVIRQDTAALLGTTGKLG
jgi:PKD domain